MISKSREIGVGVCFLEWLASRHSGWNFFYSCSA